MLRRPLRLVVTAKLSPATRAANNRVRRPSPKTPTGPSHAEGVATRLESGHAVSAADVTAAVLSARGTPREADIVWRLFNSAEASSTQLDARALAGFLAACGRGAGWDALGRAETVWAAAARGGFASDAYVLSAYVSALGRAGRCDAAFEAVEQARSLQTAWTVAPDTVCWNALLAAALRAGQHARVHATYEAGLREGLSADPATVTALVQTHVAEGEYDAAASCAERAMQTMKPTARLVSAALTACGRGGDVARAWRIYVSSRVTADAATITALIDACGADADAAWRAFHEGTAAGLSLAGCEAAVSALLVAFARGRDAARALLFFDSIRSAWPARRPPRVCYLLLRDAAAAAGDVAVAQRVAAIMAAELPRRDQPGRPGEQLDMPTVRTGLGMPVATFTAEGAEWSTSNGEAEGSLPEGAPQRRLLHGAGRELVAALGEAYVPDLSCVMLAAGGEPAQRQTLACHAEKKALGALLLRVVDPAQPARVGVSIRMCRDCHALYAAASTRFKRELRCDDGHSHVFVDGVCSCGGRWR